MSNVMSRILNTEKKNKPYHFLTLESGDKNFDLFWREVSSGLFASPESKNTCGLPTYHHVSDFRVDMDWSCIFIHHQSQLQVGQLLSNSLQIPLVIWCHEQDIYGGCFVKINKSDKLSKAQFLDTIEIIKEKIDGYNHEKL